MEYEILYTHQKTKKAKTWQDGFLRMPPPKSQAKAVLFSDNKMRLQSFLPKKQKYEVGDEMETERYLIQIDNLCSTPIATSQSSQDSQPGATSEVTPSPPVRPRHDGGEEEQQQVIKANPLRVGLKRKRTGFVVPRQVKPSQAHVSEDDYAESVTGNLIPANLPPQPLPRLPQSSLYTSVQVINATSADKNESISSIINTRQEMINSRQYPPSKRPDVQPAEVQPAPYSEDNQMTWEELKKDMMSNSKYKSKAPRAGQWKPPTGHSELVVPKPNDTTLSSSLTNSGLSSRADEDDGLMSLPEPYEASTPVVTPGVNHSKSLTDTSAVSLPPSPPPARTQKRSLQDIMMLINAPKDVKLNHTDQEVAPAAGNAASPQVSLSPSLDGAYDEGIISYSPVFQGESSFHDPINEFNNFKSNSFDSYGDKISEPRCLDKPKPDECNQLHEENNTCDDDILYRNSSEFDESCEVPRRDVPDSGKEMDDEDSAYAVSMAVVSPNSSMVGDTVCNNSIPGLKPGCEAASPDTATLHDHDGGILASSDNKSPGLLVDGLNLTSVDRSHGFLVEKSPESFVESSPESYVESSPESYVVKSHGSCIERSTESYVEKSPGSSVEKSTGSCVDKSPGSSVEKSLGSCVEKLPESSVDKSPGSSVEKSPGSYVEKLPGSSCDKLTIASYNRTPVPYTVDIHTPHSNQVTPTIPVMEKPVIATQSYGICNSITLQQDSTTDIKPVSSQETNTSLIDEAVVNPRDKEELPASDRMLVFPGSSGNDFLSQSSHQHTASTPINVTDAGHSNALPADHHKKSPDINAGALSNNVGNEGNNFFSPLKDNVDVVRSNSATNFTTSPEHIHPVNQLNDSITTPNTSPASCPEEETSRADHTVPDLSCQAQVFSGYSQEDVCFDLQFDLSQMDSDCGGQEGAQRTNSTEVNEGLLCDANICGPIAVSNGRLSPAIVPFMDSAISHQSATEHVRIANNCTANGVASLDHDAMVVVDGANSSFDSAHPPHILQTGPSNLRDIQFSPDDCMRDIDESSSSEPFNDIPTQHIMGSMQFKVDPATTSDNSGKVQNQPHIDFKQDALQENITSDDSQVANLLFQQNTSPTDTLLAGIDTTECNPGHKVVARNFHCVDVTDETESSGTPTFIRCFTSSKADPSNEELEQYVNLLRQYKPPEDLPHPKHFRRRASRSHRVDEAGDTQSLSPSNPQLVQSVEAVNMKYQSGSKCSSTVKRMPSDHMAKTSNCFSSQSDALPTVMNFSAWPFPTDTSNVSKLPILYEDYDTSLTKLSPDRVFPKEPTTGVNMLGYAHGSIDKWPCHNGSPDTDSYTSTSFHSVPQTVSRECNITSVNPVTLTLIDHQPGQLGRSTHGLGQDPPPHDILSLADQCAPHIRYRRDDIPEVSSNHITDADIYTEEVTETDQPRDTMPWYNEDPYHSFNELSPQDGGATNASDFDLETVNKYSQEQQNVHSSIWDRYGTWGNSKPQPQKTVFRGRFDR